MVRLRIIRSPGKPGGFIGFVGLSLVTAALFIIWPRETLPTCPPPARHPEWSVARRWDEALLGAIRRALPNPPLHARNLFHMSVAMWDSWKRIRRDSLRLRRP